MAHIRASAAAAFVWLGARETLRTALNSRSRPQQLVLQPGMEVYYYEQQGARRRLADLPVATQGPRPV
eukprot:9621062-Lingulodinium_polyedra.AAC.1